jgi:hypothetical protein
MIWFLLAAVAAVVVWAILRPKHQPSRALQRQSAGGVASSAAPTVDMKLSDFFALVEQTIHAQDWAAARGMLQKVAYMMVRPEISASEKAQFKALMTLFAARDPLYLETIPHLQRLLSTESGIKQSDLTRNHPNAEEMRYVLYFAAELGEVRRVKSGNTYRLYRPDDPAADQPAPDKPKRTRKKLSP